MIRFFYTRETLRVVLVAPLKLTMHRLPQHRFFWLAFSLSLTFAFPAACSDDTQEEDPPNTSTTSSQTSNTGDTTTSAGTSSTTSQTSDPDAGDTGDDLDAEQPDVVEDITPDTPQPDVPEDTTEPDTSDLDTSDDVSEDTSISDVPDEDSSSDPWPLDGFGTISGACNVLDDELTSSGPSVVVNAIDFASDPFDEEQDIAFLTEGGQEIIADGNAGGSSVYSEVFSYEVLARCEGASLLKTETEIVYNDPEGKITDILVEIDELTIGVSVTRAVGFPREDPYTVEQARGLLERKLQGVLDSTANVSAEDAWTKQILHIIAYAPQHAEAMEQAHAELSDEVRADTIVWITVSDGDDEFLY